MNYAVVKVNYVILLGNQEVLIVYDNFFHLICTSGTGSRQSFEHSIQYWKSRTLRIIESCMLRV